VEGLNQDKSVADLHPNIDDKKRVVYVYDEAGPTAYLSRMIERSRHESNGALRRKEPDRLTEHDTKKTVQEHVVVTVTEVEDEDDQATVLAPVASSYNDKGKALVRTTSLPSMIHFVSPLQLGKHKDEAKAMVQITPPAGSTVMSSKALSFEVDGSASMTKHFLDLASAKSNQADVTENGKGNARMPAAATRTCTARPTRAQKRGRRVSEPTLRRQADTSGSQALKLDLL
jgi:hypothetical protein